MPNRWRLVLSYLRPSRRAVVGGVVALVVGNVCMLVAPVLMQKGMLAIEKPLRGDAEVATGRVMAFAAAALGVVALGALSTFLKRLLLMRTSRRVETDLRRDFFAHLQRVPLRYFDRVRTGDLMSRATADMGTVRMAIGPAMMYLVDSALTLVGAVCVMLYYNAELTLYALMPLLGIAAGFLVFAPRIHRVSRAVQDQLAAISARAQESFAGGRIVKTFAIEDHEQAALEGLGKTYLETNVRLARIRGMVTAWTSLMGALGMAIIVYVGGRQTLAGRFDISSMMLFATLQFRLVWPMIAFGWVFSLVQRGAAGADRIAEVFAEPTEASVDGTAAGRMRGEIVFRDLTFAYDGKPVLEDVSLRIPAGSTLGVVGPTGSGKTTLVSLLARLYDPPRNSLHIDGKDVHGIALDELRGAIAFVPQEAFLFSTTIRDNIAFGRPDAPAEVIERAVDDACLRSDLEDFPDGAATVVGERGVTLSGGQKQRTALARALAADAPILVLDDALSAVDTETETAILRSLRRVRAGRTVIIVAHRISAVRDADQVCFLRDGRVVETGTHDELIAAGGDYARLAKLQEIEAEIEAMDP